MKLVYSALLRVHRFKRRVIVAYCDTGVEIPTARREALRVLRRLAEEARVDGLPIVTRIAQPPLANRFFVKVIGRGYPTPTNKFRWCTDRLRIHPMQKLLAGVPNATIVLGARTGESAERDRVLSKHRIAGSSLRYRQAGRTDVTVLAPVVDFSVADIWTTLATVAKPTGLEGQRILELYREAGADCPSFRTEHGTACGAGRFGCWTCTVVRKDRSVTGLVSSGHTELLPLLNFRNWLAWIRDVPEARCTRRRNGRPGPGPLTLKIRRQALALLKQAEQQSGMKLIEAREVRAIKALWKADRESPTYRE